LTGMPKDQGRVLATPLEIQRARAILALVRGPVQVLPTTSEHEVLPFAIGLFEELKAMRNAEVSVSALRRATSAYVHSRRYYLASARDGAMRHGLDGRPGEPVSDRDRAAAIESVRALDEAHGRTTAPPVPVPVDKATLIKSGLLPRASRKDVDLSASRS